MVEPPAGPSVAVIPARGGSKRIPRKNVKPFLGVPVLVRTLQVVQSSGVFDRVVVSTDDDEVAALALDAGAEVPFRRPAELSDDHTGTRSVMEHAINSLEDLWRKTLQSVCSVYPTAVSLEADDLKASYEMLRATGADFVFSVTTFPAPIQRALRRLPDGSCEMFDSDHRLTRSQDLEQAFHDAGQFYWGRRDAWLGKSPVFERASQLFVLPRWRVQDIDTTEDWRRAELMERARKLQRDPYDTRT